MAPTLATNIVHCASRTVHVRSNPSETRQPEVSKTAVAAKANTARRMKTDSVRKCCDAAGSDLCHRNTAVDGGGPELRPSIPTPHTCRTQYAGDTLRACVDDDISLRTECTTCGRRHIEMASRTTWKSRRTKPRQDSMTRQRRCRRAVSGTSRDTASQSNWPRCTMMRSERYNNFQPMIRVQMFGIVFIMFEHIIMFYLLQLLCKIRK